MAFKIWVAPATSTVNITLYHQQASAGSFGGYVVWFQTTCGGFSQQWTANDCVSTSTCTADQTLTFSQNQTVYVWVEGCTIGGISFRAVDNSSTCPGGGTVFCDGGDCLGTPFSFNTGTTNKNIALTVVTSKFGYTACV